ncbi:MAG: glycosyltransferase [Burkholderiaceae bacterium]|nr:glycosyltransferase [Burkholderiaceae bacterium]
MTPRRRVLFLIPTLRGGGAERVMTTLLKHLDRGLFELTLGVVDTRDAAYRDDIPHDVTIIDFRCRRVRHALPRVIRCIWSLRPHVVFSTLGHLNLALAVLRPFFPPATRLIARETIVVSYGLRSHAWTGLWALGYRWFYRRIDHLVCQSQDMRDDLVAGFGFPAHKATVINNPVDVEAIRKLATVAPQGGLFLGPRAGDASLRLVAAGRLCHQKGFDLLIRALARLGDPRVRLSLLGEGPLEGQLRELAADLGVRGQVDFVGFVKNPSPFFAAADAFVLSSRYEGFPNVVLEALACGTPVIATPAPGASMKYSVPFPNAKLPPRLPPRRSRTPFADGNAALGDAFRRPVSSLTRYQT